MKTMFRLGVIMAALFVAFNIVLLGCGGGPAGPGSGGGGGTPGKPAAFFSFNPLGHQGGLHPTIAHSKVATTYSIHHGELLVEAATNFSAAGSYNGNCAKMPNVTFPGMYMNGAGSPFGSNDCAANFTNSTAAGICDTVVGDGTLQNLIITGSGGAFSNSGHIQVIVFVAQKDVGGNITGFVKTTTPLQATLGLNPRVDDDVNSFAVHDKDTVCMTIDALSSDSLNNVKAMVFKTVAP
jgi:hypothetical protein